MARRRKSGTRRVPGGLAYRRDARAVLFAVPLLGVLAAATPAMAATPPQEGPSAGAYAGAPGSQGFQGPWPHGPSGDAYAGAPGPQGFQGATGARGAAGPPGGAGVAGPQGVVGPAGPQGVTGVRKPQGGGAGGRLVQVPVTRTVSAGTRVTAACPGGYLVTGGGASVTKSTGSLAVNSPSSATGWQAAATASGEVTAIAVCAPVS